MKRFLSIVVLSVLAVSAAFGQGTAQKFGPLTVTIPARWVTQGTGGSTRFFSPDSTPQQYFAIEFFPPAPAAPDFRTQHSQVLTRLAALGQPAAPVQNGTLGPFIWSRLELRRGLGQTETVIVYSAAAASSYIAVVVDATRADLVTKNLPVVTAMLEKALLGGNAPQPPASQSPRPQFTASAASPSLNNYVFTAPSGWKTDNYPDGITLTSPTYNTGERCLLQLWPMRPSGTSLPNDANAIFQEVFRTYEPRTESSDGMSAPPILIRGTSGAGWDYVIVKRAIGKPRDARGTYETLQGFVMTAKLGNTVAAVSGLSKSPIVSSCFGELIADVWPRFFYSLEFKNWTPADHAASITKLLAGVWITVTSTVADQWAFAANGRFASASAVQNYTRISSTELLETTQAFFGDGAYKINQNTITLTKDSNPGQPVPGWFRIEEESKDGGRTWAPIFYLLRVSSVDGKDYEVRYKKQQ